MYVRTYVCFSIVISFIYCIVLLLPRVQSLGLQPEEGFILKIVQLQELIDVRHSVFVIGNAGTGKSQVHIHNITHVCDKLTYHYVCTCVCSYVLTYV